MRNFIYCICLVTVVVITGCTKDKAKINTCTECVPVSFNADIIPILAKNCALSGCHDAADANDGLVLDSANAYASINSQGTGYLVPGDPNNSIFYAELLPGSSEPMPQPPYPALDACTIKQIQCWILQGGKNN